MRLYITLEKAAAEKVAHALGVELAVDLESAEGALLFFKNSAGGVLSPADVITKPDTTIVVAGVPNDETIDFAEDAASAGVPESNIIFTALRGIKISDIQPLLRIINPSLSPAKSGAPQLVARQPAAPAPRIVKITRVIGFVGCKGGVGRTTYAASLVAHYATVSEKSVLLDVNLPHNGKYHLTSADSGNVVEGTANQIEELTPGYRRVVVDLAPSFESLKMIEKVIVIVDADTIQSLDPTVEALQKEGVVPCAVVYNRKRAEVPKEIIEASFSGVRVITVDDDFAGCQAALAAGVPASMRSEAVARAVGEIAAIIDREV